jgi:tetratricopeptide (TPR) repeat protein
MRALIFLGACQGKLGEYDAADKTLAQAMVLVNKYVMKSTYESAVLQIKGDMLVQQKKYKQAQAVYMEANRIDQQQDGPKRVNQGLTLHSLAELAKKEGNYSTAADYYRKEIALYATRLSPQATELVKPYTDLASVLRKLHRESDARQAEAMALKIQNSTASTPIPLKLK